jgi:Sulfotransferase domain
VSLGAVDARRRIPPARSPRSYGRVRWVGYLVARNLGWARTQGVRRLAEEHEVNPFRRAARAVQKARWRRTHHVEPGHATPVFVFGLPRSGTNMLMRALTVSPEVVAYNDGDHRAFERYRLRENDVVRELVLTSRQRFVVFKPILDGHRALTLLDDLGVDERPKAVWLYRNVDGRTRSALEKFGTSALDAMRDIAAGTAADWQAQGLSGESLELIRSIDWDRATPADGASMVWYVKNRLYFEHRLDERADVLPLPYDVLAREPEKTMRIVCGFLGISWDPRVAAGIDTRSVGRRPSLPLDLRLRARCDDLTADLDAAAAAAGLRIS